MKTKYKPRRQPQRQPRQRSDSGILLPLIELGVGLAVVKAITK